MGGIWKALTEAILELVYPPRQICPLCGGAQPQGAICDACALLLADYAQSAVCNICGVLLPDAANSRYCPVCMQQKRHFTLARSAGPYEGGLRAAIHRFKYRGQQSLAKPLGALMAQVARQEPAFRRSQALVPVPLSTGRLKQRGFNQAALLARELSVIWDVPVWEQAVVKLRETPPQTRLSRRARLQNLQQAFEIFDVKLVQGKIITVVDDVLTTGATASTISHALRQAGAKQVLVLTLATTRFGDKK